MSFDSLCRCFTQVKDFKINQKQLTIRELLVKHKCELHIGIYNFKGPSLPIFHFVNI